ncbi:MAG: hypothetical protein ACLTBV_00280 [Enterocloster bolteae]
MIISTTGTADGNGTFLVYHGPYREIIPRMAACGYKGVEMHIEDSVCILRDELWELLRAYGMRLTSIGTGAIYGKRHYNLVDSDSSIRQAAIGSAASHDYGTAGSWAGYNRPDYRENAGLYLPGRILLES